MDYQQCSVAPYLLGLPLLTSLPQDDLLSVPSHSALIPPTNASMASGEVTVRSAPEAWRAADSPRLLAACPPRRSSSSTRPSPFLPLRTELLPVGHLDLRGTRLCCKHAAYHQHHAHMSALAAAQTTVGMVVPVPAASAHPLNVPSPPSFH